MSNFLVILPTKGNFRESKEMFRQGIQFAQQVRQQAPSEQIESDWACVATFPRMNGSLCPLILDKESGDWLLVSGTWFHQEGWGCGNEQRLLGRLQSGGLKNLAHELEGFFVLVYGDARTQEISVVTDVIGSCHAFHRLGNGVVAVSGSSLLLASLASFSLDSIASQEFILTGVMYEDRTFYQEVRKLAPASVSIYFDGRSIETYPYWQAKDLIPESLDGDEALEVVSRCLLRVVRVIGENFSKPVCDLTGGY
ncbi:MAG: hypothetical protein OEY91_12800, partial [Nitrospirota bacterium]|nr:hypothetical protein [Nitrospirota bacterium]